MKFLDAEVNKQENKDRIKKEILFLGKQHRKRGVNFIVEIFGIRNETITVMNTTLLEVSIDGGHDYLLLEKEDNGLNYVHEDLYEGLQRLDYYEIIYGYRVYPVTASIDIKYGVDTVE